MFYSPMERIDVSAIAQAILEAPGWARVGITLPSDHMRRQSARELAQTIADRIDGESQKPDPDQLLLSL